MIQYRSRVRWTRECDGDLGGHSGRGSDPAFRPCGGGAQRPSYRWPSRGMRPSAFHATDAVAPMTTMTGVEVLDGRESDGSRPRGPLERGAAAWRRGGGSARVHGPLHHQARRGEDVEVLYATASGAARPPVPTLPPPRSTPPSISPSSPPSTSTCRRPGAVSACRTGAAPRLPSGPRAGPRRAR
jgi:hypothetical protein